MWKPPCPAVCCHQSTLWRSWQEALRFTEIQLPFWQCALAAKASAVLSWAALGKLLPAAPQGDPSPWLSTSEATPGGLCSVLAPHYRRDVDVLERVEARARDGEGSGAALLWVKAEKTGTVQPAGEKAWGDFYFSIYVETNYHKGGCNEGGAGLFSVVSRGTARDSGHRTEPRRFLLNITNHLFAMRLPLEVMDSPSLELFKSHLALGDPAWAVRAGQGDLWRFLPTLTISWFFWPDSITFTPTPVKLFPHF